MLNIRFESRPKLGGFTYKLPEKGKKLDNRFLEGLSFAEKGEHLKAIERYETLLVPGNIFDANVVVAKVTSLHCLAEKMMQKGEADNSNEHLEEALDTLAAYLLQDRSDQGIWCEMGKHYLIRGNLDEAVKHFKRALDIDPKAADSIIYRAVIASYEADHFLSVDYFAQARNSGYFFCDALNRCYANELIAQAVVMTKLKGFKAAMDYCEKAEKIYPSLEDSALFDMASVFVACGKHFMDNNDMMGAIHYLSKALVKDPTDTLKPKIKLDLLQCMQTRFSGLLGGDNVDQALLIIDQVKRINPGSWDTKEKLANLYTELGNYFTYTKETVDYDRALEYYDEALKTVRDLSYAIISKAECLNILERFDETIELLEGPEEILIENPMFMYHLGTAYLKLENYEEASEKFTLLLKSGTYDERAYRKLGDVAFLQADFKEAVSNYKRSVESISYKESEFALYSNAMLCYISKDLARAQEYMEAYLGRYPKGYDKDSENMLKKIKEDRKEKGV